MPLFYTVKSFMKAARNGDEAEVRKYFSWNGTAQWAGVKDGQGNTALHAAAQGGLDGVIRDLIEAGADASTRNRAGQTALFDAVAAQSAPALQALLEAGADPNLADASGARPLDQALHRRVELVDMLLAKGADPNNPNNPLVTATRYGKGPAALRLLEAGAKPDAHGGDYCYPLHYAAKRGETDVLRALVARNVDVNVRDRSGQTPLHYAAAYGSAIAVEFLLTQGAQTHIEDDQGRTALALAEENDEEQVVKLLQGAASKPSQAPLESSAPASGSVTPAGDTETWMLAGAEKVAHVGLYPAMGRRITEIFNFAARERMIVTENLKTGAETVTQPEKFETLSDESLRPAMEAYDRLRGASDSARKKTFRL